MLDIETTTLDDVEIHCTSETLVRIFRTLLSIYGGDFKLTYGKKYSRMDQENMWKTTFKKYEGIWSA